MKTVLMATMVLTMALTGCAKADALDNAIDAGNAMNKAMEKCVTYAKAKGNMDIPECDSTKQHDAYLDAKSKVRNASPALEAIDKKAQILSMQAMALIFKK